jgi:hypothetical protein
MLRFVIAGSSLITLFAICDVSNAQVGNIAPYIGASGSLGTIDHTLNYGWGIEGGARFFPFYGGLEYGVYYKFPTAMTTDPVVGQVPPPVAISSAQYVGIHAGYVMSDSTLIGIVVLRSYQLWDTPDSSEEGVISTQSFWDFGVDIRYAGIDNGHMYLAFAFTFRRGLKAGLGYMF